MKTVLYSFRKMTFCAVAMLSLFLFGEVDIIKDISEYKSFTIALKIKPKPVYVDRNVAGMVAYFGSGWHDGFRLEIMPTRKGFYPILEIGGIGGSWMLKDPERRLNPGVWSHLATTWDGKVARLYINGEKIAEEKRTDPLLPLHNKHNRLKFATRPDYGLEFYPVEFKEKFLSVEALSEDDIKRMAAGFEKPDDRMVEEQERLYIKGRKLWYKPSKADIAEMKKEWEDRDKNAIGPAPVLPRANKPIKESAKAFYVSPLGSDSNSGTEASPFATLSAARNAIRALKSGSGMPKDGVTVYIRGGRYAVKETFALSAEDSGEDGAGILYAAYGDEKPVFSGAFPIKGFQKADHPRLPQCVRGKALVADLKSQGYVHLEPLEAYGYHVGEYTGKVPMTDLYLNGERLELARWPDTGWRKMKGGNPTNNTIKIELDDWAKWKQEPELMVTMYPSALWADVTCLVTNLDETASVMHVKSPRKNARCFTRIRLDAPYFFVNAMCALDKEGEWFIDRKEGKLYVVPVAGRTDGYELSTFNDPFITLTDVKNVEFRGLTFECGRADAIIGEKMKNVTFDSLTVRNFGNDGIRAIDSEKVTITKCKLRNFGHGAIKMTGGDRKTLAPAGHVVEKCDISRVEQWKRTYAPGLLLFGCGVRVEGNHFYDMRSSAMRLEGNDFLIASNLVEDVVLESDDQGGIDIYANPTFAIRIIGNVWRNIGRGGDFVKCGQAGVRFDDVVSNMIVEGNRFENCSWVNFGAIQINGGRNNTILNNTFVNCKKTVSASRRPKKWWEKTFSSSGFKYRMYEEVDISSELYKKRYPYIDRLPTDETIGNRFWRNTIIGETEGVAHSGTHTDMRANLLLDE